MREEALPLWMRTGRNLKTGLFYERLTRDGVPDHDAELRVRTHLRQVYVLAHASVLGLCPAEAARTAAFEAMERLRDRAWGTGGRPGWAHRLSASAEVIDERRDLYDHAFALLALGWLFRATGEAGVLRWIDQTLDTIDTQMAAPAGGWAESDRHELPRRQNPHMHLFEACLALHETTGEERHLARAAEIFGLFKSRFFDDVDGVVLEFFDENWQLSPVHGHRLDPGHMMEWVWLLRRFERAAGQPVHDMCERLFASGERLGRNERTGFLVDEVDSGAVPLTPGSRLWLQTEYIKALIVQGTALQDRRLIMKADDLSASLARSFLAAAAPGCWIDRLDLEGAAAADTVPASTLYHLFAAAAVMLSHPGTTSTAAPVPA